MQRPMTAPCSEASRSLPLYLEQLTDWGHSKQPPEHEKGPDLEQRAPRRVLAQEDVPQENLGSPTLQETLKQQVAEEAWQEDRPSLHLHPLQACSEGWASPTAFSRMPPDANPLPSSYEHKVEPTRCSSPRLPLRTLPGVPHTGSVRRKGTPCSSRRRAGRGSAACLDSLLGCEELPICTPASS